MTVFTDNDRYKLTRLYDYLQESAETDCLCGRDEGRRVPQEKLCAYCLIKDTAQALQSVGFLAREEVEDDQMQIETEGD